MQRWLKFVKYLQEFDIEPIVYTVENPSLVIEDASLTDEIPDSVEIIKKPIFEPNQLLSFINKNEQKQSSGFLNPNPTFLGKCLQYIRANYFIPDARKFWIKPSVKFLKKYIKENPVDLIITTGPPHSLHMIGMGLKEQCNVKWISDFRDPWTEIDYFHQLPLTAKSKRKHQLLEGKIVKQSDAVITVGQYMKHQFSKFNSNIHVITNGFDGDVKSTSNVELNNKFSITHVGLMNADRNPKQFWKVINELCNEIEGFKDDIHIRLVGNIAQEVEDSLKKLPIEIVEHIPYVSHNEVKKYQSTTQLLLLAINNVPSAKGIITGKIFEYLQAKRPILAIGPVDGDAAEIISKSGAGTTIDFNDKDSLKSYLIDCYQQYKKENLVVQAKGIEQYHRKELTKQLASLIRSTV